MSETRIPISNSEFDECTKFSETVYETMHYLSSRGQYDPSTCKRQHRDGKLAEYAVYHYLDSLCGLQTTKPDLLVTADKSYGPDLTVYVPWVDGNTWRIPLSVKSQNRKMEEGFGVSWVFQWADKDGNQEAGNTDWLFDPKNWRGLIVPVTVVTYSAETPELVRYGIIRGAVFPRDVMPEVEKSLPKKEELRLGKRVLEGAYLNSLPSHRRWQYPFNRLRPPGR